jgi:hypothetical protein
MYVSNRTLGTSGQEPSGTNKYLVGVPRPSGAMVDTRTTFHIPGIVLGQPFNLTMFCESPDGTRSEEATAHPVVTTNTPAAFKFQVSMSGLTCAAATATSGTSSGVGPALLIGVAEVPDKNFDGQEVTAIQAAVEVYQRGAELLFRFNKPVEPNNVVASNMNLIHVKYNGTTYTYNSWNEDTLFPASTDKLWFSTVEGAQEPTSTLTSQSASATLPVVSWTFTRLDGGTGTVLFRSDGAQLPTEMSGLEADVTRAGDVMTVTLRTSAAATESRAYTYTYVNNYGEEGDAAEPVVLDCVNGQAVTLSYTPPGTHSYNPISKIRVYRTATGSQSTEYLFVAEVDVNTTAPSVTDEVKTENLGEPIATTGFLPPESGLVGLCNMGNGILAAFKQGENEVHISQAYLPYAWKSANIITTPGVVKGICPFENGLYVTTTAEPIVITGVDPDSLTNQIVPALQAGVSKGSICNVGPYAAYASHDGIVLLRGLDASLQMSQKFFTRDVWRERYGNKLSVIKMAAHDGNLLVYFTDGTAPFLIRFDEENPSLTALTTPVTCHAINPYADALYVVSNGTLREFKGSSSRLAYTWHSKDFITPTPTNFAFMQMVGSGTVTVKVYADGVLKHTKTTGLATHERIVFPLPSGFLARRWSIEVAGAADSYVTEAYLVNAVAELQGV